MAAPPATAASAATHTFDTRRSPGGDDGATRHPYRARRARRTLQTAHRGIATGKGAARPTAVPRHPEPGAPLTGGAPGLRRSGAAGGR